MKFNKLLLTGLFASALFTIPATAEEEDEHPLAVQMSTMNDAYKAIRREKDPAKGAELAREAQDAMIKAITILPELVTEMPEGDEKAKAAANYRKMMGELIATLGSMELAFLDGDMEKVKEVVKEMRDSKKSGHDQFMEEE